MPSKPPNPDTPPIPPVQPVTSSAPVAPGKPFVDYHSAWVSNLDEMPDEMLIAAVEAIRRRANLHKRPKETLKKILDASAKLGEELSKHLD